LPTNSGKAKEPTKGNAANLIFHAAHSAGCKPKTVFMLLLLLLVPLMPWLCCWTARIWRSYVADLKLKLSRCQTQNTKHQSNKTENPAQSGGQTKLSSTLRCSIQCTGRKTLSYCPKKT